jgi:hypothetical protein
LGKINWTKSYKDMNKTIDKRQDINKKLLLEQLQKIPVVEIACQKLGIGRASYYRWRAESKEFAKEADEAIREGRELGNDMSESQILKAIRDGNLSAAYFWLKHNSKNYATKVELTANIKPDEELTPEQQETVRKALALTGLSEEEKEK